MPTLSPSMRVTLALLLVAACFLGFAWETDAPWQGLAQKRVGRALDMPKKEVPLEVYRDFQQLGGMNLGVESYRQIGLWYAAIAVGSILAAAGLTARWWVPLTARRPRDGSILQQGTEKSSTIQPGRIGWIGLAAFLLLAVVLRGPHLDRSLYFDEQDNLRRNFHGHLEIRPDGQEIWRGAGWQEALWENRLGNNPVFLSVACQASLRIWRVVTGADRQRFDVVALRLPVLLAGLASIAALWWLLQLWGLRFAAAFAAGFAAIHPMHIDYSLQARGYAFVLLFVALAMGFAWLALKHNRWRDWFALGFCVFFCVWSYAGSVYFALAVNAGILGLLIWRGLRQKDAGFLGPITRLLCVNAVTGLLYLFLISPHLPQVSYHFREVFELIPLQPFWIFYAWSHYSTGTNFPNPQDIYDLRTEATTLPEVLFQRMLPAEPILMAIQWLILPALIVIGIIWLRRKSHTDARVAPATFLLTLGFAAPVIALIHQHFTSLYFYYWYLSYTLPVIIGAVAVGFQALLLRSNKPIAMVSVAIFFTLFLWQVTPISGREGRVNQNPEWPVNEDGVEAVEFQRGRSHWIATRDGKSICLKDVYDASGKRQRAGRE